jgi:copper chaperone
MTDLILKIEGMSCKHCVMSVEKAISSVEGTRSSDVSVGSASVTYDETKTSREAIVSAVQNAGYKVVG